MKKASAQLQKLFFWRRHPDSNWGIEVLQTFALPLGHVAISIKQGAELPRPVVLAGVAGFEPATDGVRVRCLTAWRYPNSSM